MVVSKRHLTQSSSNPKGQEDRDAVSIFLLENNSTVTQKDTFPPLVLRPFPCWLWPLWPGCVNRWMQSCLLPVSLCLPTMVRQEAGQTAVSLSQCWILSARCEEDLVTSLLWNSPLARLREGGDYESISGCLYIPFLIRRCWSTGVFSNVAMTGYTGSESNHMSQKIRTVLNC